MLGKKEGIVTGSGELNALLGRGSEFQGTLKFEGTVRIDGKFNGEVHSDGTLIVGDSAVMEAEVKVGVAVISGTVNGNVEAKQKLELHAPAKLTGNITTPSLSMQDGVLFNGNCQMAAHAVGEQKKVSILGLKSKSDKEEN